MKALLDSFVVLLRTCTTEERGNNKIIPIFHSEQTIKRLSTNRHSKPLLDHHQLHNTSSTTPGQKPYSEGAAINHRKHRHSCTHTIYSRITSTRPQTGSGLSCTRTDHYNSSARCTGIHLVLFTTLYYTTSARPATGQCRLVE